MLGTFSPHPDFILTSVALVSPSAAVSVRSLSVCRSQKKSDPRRKQGEKANQSGQTGRTGGITYVFSLRSVAPYLPTGGYGYEQSKEEAEPGVFSRAPPRSRPEARTQWAALTCLLLQFRTSNCPPETLFSTDASKSSPKKILNTNQMEVQWIHIYSRIATLEK